MQERERFVPQRAGHVARDLAATFDVADDGADFAAFARIVSALYHFDFHDHEQAVLEAWDATLAGDDDAASVLVHELRRFLGAANYVEITVDELEDAMARESLIPLRLEVDLDVYDDLVLFRRSSQEHDVEVRRWRGLRTRHRRITVEDRVVVLARIKPAAWFAERGLDPAVHDLEPGSLTLKQFQQVPRADIEMLLPSTRVRYRPIDTLAVGLPALVSGIVVLATKLLPTIGLVFVVAGAWLGLRDEEPDIDQGALVALLGGLVAVGGFVLRQWNKLKNRRVEYLKTLSETLYFRTLADGPGVLHTLLTSAEQQEVIEVLVAYRFLLASPDGCTPDELDGAAERWLLATCGADVDFDIVDGLAKLRRLDLVGDDGNRLRALPLGAALTRLDERWDALFHHGAGAVPLSR